MYQPPPPAMIVEVEDPGGAMNNVPAVNVDVQAAVAQDEAQQEVEEPPTLGRPRRQVRRPSRLQDFM